MAGEKGTMHISPSPELVAKLSEASTEIEKLRRISAAYKAEGYDVSDIDRMLSAISDATEMTRRSFKM